MTMSIVRTILGFPPIIPKRTPVEEAVHRTLPLLEENSLEFKQAAVELLAKYNDPCCSICLNDDGSLQRS